MKVKGKIIPIRDGVIVSDMNFDMEKTATGIYIPTDNGKAQGIHPRWGRVWAIGPDQTDVNIGEWVLVEHGRWTRTIELESDDGDIIELRKVDNNAILATADEKPEDWMRSAA
jgi:co-chaperonin GroES (HSP10)